MSDFDSNQRVCLEFQAMVDVRDGYGSCSPYMALAFERAGFCVHLSAYNEYFVPGLPERCVELLAKNGCVSRQPTVSLIMAWPPMLGPDPNRYVYTMFETDRILPAWANALNQCKGIFVPSQSSCDAFQNSGVTSPIFVAPLGVDGSIWPTVDRTPASRTRPFTFGFCGVPIGRKNATTAIRGFKNAFPLKEDSGKDLSADVRLLIKTRSWYDDPEGIVRNEIGDDFRISLISKDYLQEEMSALFQNEIDCLVAPSHGEGFNLLPLQAMATSMPVIISKHSGMEAYQDDRYNYSIKTCPKVRADAPPDIWGYIGSESECGFARWWDPDQDECTALMRYVYDNQDEAYVKGTLAAQWVREKFTWDRTVSCIISGVQESAPNLKDILQNNVES